MVIPITRGMAKTVTSRQLFLIATGNMVTPTIIDRVMPIGTAAMTTNIRLTINRMDITATAGTLYVIGESNCNLQDPTPEYTRSNQVVSVTLSVQLPLISRNTWMRRLLLHQSHQKLVYSSQVIENVPENLGGSTFCEKVIRHLTSPVHTSNIVAETEIVHIGRKSHNECAVITMIGARS